jgi:beta-lactamase regulating signal transducer with metallopeptidase domain
MPVFLLYLIKLSLGIAAVYCFYRLLLRRLTFYQFNRWYLAVYPMLCFFIPFIDVAPLAGGADGTGNTVFGIPSVQQYVAANPADMIAETSKQVSMGPISPWTIVGIILVAGMLFLLIRLLVRLTSLMRIKKQAVLVSNYEAKLYKIPGEFLPFSFADGIYINTDNYSPGELQKIIRHEEVHVHQKHSVDIFIGELLCIINWYNPFAWLLRHSIRQNLEFIADNAVLNAGTDKKAYQYLLLKVTGIPVMGVANQFNFSSLKKRITMMNRIKSARPHLLKFAFVLPLAAVLLLAFRSPLEKSSSPGPNTITYAGIVYDVDTKLPIAGVAISDSISGKKTITDERGYFEFVFTTSARKHRMANKLYKEGYLLLNTGCGTDDLNDPASGGAVEVLLEGMKQKDSKTAEGYGLYISSVGFRAADPLYPQVQKFADEYYTSTGRFATAGK